MIPIFLDYLLSLVAQCFTPSQQPDKVKLTLGIVILPLGQPSLGPVVSLETAVSGDGRMTQGGLTIFTQNISVKSFLCVLVLSGSFLQVADPNTRLGPNHFRYNYDSGRSGVYINYREVSNRFELEPGHYIIIPSSFQKDDSASFLIRAFAQKKFTLAG